MSNIPRPVYCSRWNLHLALLARNIVHLDCWPQSRLQSHKSISSPITVAREYLASPLTIMRLWLIDWWTNLAICYHSVPWCCNCAATFSWSLNGADIAHGIKAHDRFFIRILESSCAIWKERKNIRWIHVVKSSDKMITICIGLLELLNLSHARVCTHNTYISYFPREWNILLKLIISSTDRQYVKYTHHNNTLSV